MRSLMRLFVELLDAWWNGTPLQVDVMIAGIIALLAGGYAMMSLMAVFDLTPGQGKAVAGVAAVAMALWLARIYLRR
ncbi:MAG: hypothetical protein IOC85_15660 [Rhodobacter sp.]|jgi:hypothetical protein|nr:hypothetical protein [Rhodobacter sp.]